ncbi:unnamed protein product [Polarella glacialis]|uniref:Strawberry notch AAA domain-containing protein n=1 Tax=Polarella glacialis TaxID=89957 RepID=A0A813E7G3_POLGL|nr:unnamed protein product [Polarella glacialis]
MFTTYAMLRKLETAKYIANWLGGDLAEGLIVFDEAHSAKNFVNSREGTSTMQGKMVDYLQQTCPKAPVLYASATACTEVSEMVYMPRLGLWGPGQSFGDFQGFRRAVEAKGIEGMEAVALQLKSLGVATCRSLSHEGARLAVCKAPLEPDRSEVYDRACGFFARLHSEAQAALAETWEDESGTPIRSAVARDVELDEELDDQLGDPEDPGELPEGAPAGQSMSHGVTGLQAHPRFWAAFWSCQLRFFRQLVVSLKVPEVKRRALAALAEEGQVVVTLWGTGEAQLAGAGQLELEDGAPPSCPEIMLDQFLARRFPRPPDDHVRTLLLASKDMAAALCTSSEVLAECDAASLTPDAVAALREKARLLWSLPAHSPLELVKVKRLTPDAALGGCDWGVEFRGATMAEARRASLRTELASLGLPQHPLDELLDVLGGPSHVAELSGRSHRLARGANGRWQVEPRTGGKGEALVGTNNNGNCCYMNTTVCCSVVVVVIVSILIPSFRQSSE